MADIGTDVGYWELMRMPIREALATWDDACDAPLIAIDPSPADATVGGDA